MKHFVKVWNGSVNFSREIDEKTSENLSFSQNPQKILSYLHKETCISYI